MQAHLIQEGVPAARTRVVHNWVADDIEPLPRTLKSALPGTLAQAAAPAEPFTICYSGNLGRVHDVDAIIDLIRRTADLPGPENHADSATCTGPETCRGNEPAMNDPRTGGQGEERGGGDAEPSPRTSDEAPGRAGAVSGAPATASAGLKFRFVGGGVGQARLKAAIAAHGWSHVTFEDYAPLAELGRSLAACDAHLVTLDPACESLIQPSKIYGILASGRPALFLGAGDGAIARLLARNDAGLTLDSTAPETWRPLLAALVADPARLAAMGQNARRAHEHHYARRHALAAWREVLAPAPATAPVATAAPAPAPIMTAPVMPAPVAAAAVVHAHARPSGRTAA
jgi:glycosyltransferase involved in cell wall biosynthesis